MVTAMHAAGLYDSGKECGAYANAAKYLGAEAGFKACSQAIMTHGGMGYAKEFHVERLLREVMICRIAPVTRDLSSSWVSRSTPLFTRPSGVTLSARTATSSATTPAATKVIRSRRA